MWGTELDGSWEDLDDLCVLGGPREWLGRVFPGWGASGQAGLAWPQGGLWAQPLPSELNSDSWTRGKERPGDGKMFEKAPWACGVLRLVLCSYTGHLSLYDLAKDLNSLNLGFFICEVWR